MGKWYKAGFKDALEGLGMDPPWQKGHRDHTSYCEGYEDGQCQIDGQADFDRANERRAAR
jgi:hypothetical protein